MAIGRGIMQVSRINIYPTAASFVSISPPDFATCSDLITFNVKVENTKSPFTPVPGVSDGYVSVVDITTGTIIGTSALNASGLATITNTLSNGILWLAVIYTGLNNKFKSSQSAISPYYVNFELSDTAISFPAADSYYCPDQNAIIESFTHLSGDPGTYPVGGIVEFSLWTTDSNFISLPSATVDATGHATSYIPAFTTGVPGAPTDGYYLQASFDGYECFARSDSPAGISGLKVKPKIGDTITTAISVTATPLCYQDVTFATVTLTPTFLSNPSSGTITISDKDSGTILGTGTPANGVAVIELDGYALPAKAAIDYPYIYTIWADYVPDGYCYATSSYHGDVGNQLTIKKYFATLGAPTQAGGELPDRFHTLAFNFEDIITGTAANGLSGNFEFRLYEIVIGPDPLILTFGSQAVSTAGATPETVVGVIPGGTMTATSTYYVVGIYTPSGSKCYDTTIVTSANSVTLTPA